MSHSQEAIDHFVLQATQQQWSPYLEKIPDGEQFSEQPSKIKQVDKILGGWSVHAKWSCFVPRLRENQKAPVVGGTIQTHGGLGQTIDGIMIDDELVFWRTKEMSDQRHAFEMACWKAQERRVNEACNYSRDQLGKFAVKEGQEDCWESFITKNSKDAYSFAVVLFASQWAVMMETFINLNKQPVAEIAEAAAKLVPSYKEITGFMYGAAVSTLAQCWKHGDELRRWHNKETSPEQAEEANKSGATLNPELLTIG